MSSQNEISLWPIRNLRDQVLEKLGLADAHVSGASPEKILELEKLRKLLKLNHKDCSIFDYNEVQHAERLLLKLNNQYARPLFKIMLVRHGIE